jgi:hypothetical protein
MTGSRIPLDTVVCEFNQERPPSRFKIVSIAAAQHLRRDLFYLEH